MAGLQPFSLANVLSNAASIQGQRIDNKLRNLQLQQASDPNSLQNQLIQARIADLNNADGAGLGTVNPRDFTAASIARFQESGNFNDLERFIAPKSPIRVDRGDAIELYSPTTNELLVRLPKELAPNQTPEAAADIVTAQNLANLDPDTGRAAIETSVVTAREQAQAAAAEKAQQKKNEKAANVYKKGMRNLYSGLSGAKMTGQVLGRLPAFTSPDQVADNAKAIMLPILKAAVREKGEGVFTDKDAEAILALIPDRISNKAAIPPIMSNVNDYMSATFGIEIDLSEIGIPKVISTQAEHDALPDGAVYIYEGQEFTKGQ